MIRDIFGFKKTRRIFVSKHYFDSLINQVIIHTFNQTEDKLIFQMFLAHLHFTDQHKKSTSSANEKIDLFFDVRNGNLSSFFS